jgi:hypothetical protein
MDLILFLIGCIYVYYMAGLIIDEVLESLNDGLLWDYTHKRRRKND